MRRTTTKVFAALAAGALIVAACGGDDDGPADADPPAPTDAPDDDADDVVADDDAPDDAPDDTPAVSDDDPILIGLAMDFTGAIAPFGNPIADGARLALKQKNDAGGIDGRAVEFIEDDLASDRALMAGSIRRLAGDGVVGIVGPVSSTALVVGAPVAEEEAVPMVPPSSVEQFEEGVLNEWIYRVAPVNAVALPLMVEEMLEVTPFERLAIFYDPANNASVDDVRLLEGLAEQGLFEVVAIETAEEGATEFSGQISNISAADPDAIWFAHLVEENAGFMIQARERGIDAQFLGGVTFTNREIFEIAGDAATGAVTFVPFLATADRPETQEFVAAFEAEYGSTPDVFAAQGFDATNVLISAIESAGAPERDAVREALSTLTHEGATGTVTYDGPSDNTTPEMILVRVEDEVFVPAN